MSLLLRLQRVSRLHQLTKSSTQQCTQYIHNSMQSIAIRSFSDTPKKAKKKVKKSKSDTISTESISSTSSELPLAASQAAIDGGSTAESSKRDWWRMKFYRFRRLCLIVGIPFGLMTAGFAFHESDIPYVYCLKKLAKYPLPDGFNPDDYSFPDNPPPNPAPSWAQMIPMLWASQFNSYKRL